MKFTVNYEENIQIPIKKVYDLTIQWLNSQQNPKIKTANVPTLIDAIQGTEMPDIGYDPNWKKQIRINLFDMQGEQTLVRVEATILSRNIRTSHIEKLKLAWWNGLFSGLFSMLVKMEGGLRKERPQAASQSVIKQQAEEPKVKFCPNCGKKLEEDISICPSCGIDLK